MVKTLLLIILLSFNSLSAQKKSIEPSAIETEILEIINRLRANPQKEAALIAKSGLVPGHVDMAMFKKEMDQLKAAPPLFFNLKLIEAARNHTQYQLKNTQTHVQEKGKPGFTGVGMTDRYRHVGYKGRSAGENVFIYSKSPWHGQVAFVVDWKLEGSDGGMQAGRGHRKNLISQKYTEVGVGCASVSNAAVTQNFGRAGRSVGGVAYSDKNKNGYYDAGEGLSGVKISFDGKKTKTWKSGAYVLPARKSGGKIIAQWGSRYITGLVPAGGQNFKFDFIEENARGEKMTFVSIYKINELARQQGFKQFFSSNLEKILIDGAEMDSALVYFKQVSKSFGDDQAAAKELYEKICMSLADEVEYLSKLIIVKPSHAYARLLLIRRSMRGETKIFTRVSTILKGRSSKDMKILLKLNVGAYKTLNDPSERDVVNKVNYKRVIKNYKRFLNGNSPVELRSEAGRSLELFLAEVSQ